MSWMKNSAETLTFAVSTFTTLSCSPVTFNLLDENLPHVCRLRAGLFYSFGTAADVMPLYGVTEASGAQPVRSLHPNFRGLFDMHGNVREWCHGWQSQALGLRPQRGGSWEDFFYSARCARRLSDPPDDRDGGNGLRIVFSLP